MNKTVAFTTTTVHESRLWFHIIIILFYCCKKETKKERQKIILLIFISGFWFLLWNEPWVWKKEKACFFFSLFFSFQTSQVDQGTKIYFSLIDPAISLLLTYLVLENKKNHVANRGSPVIALDVTFKTLFCVQAEFLSFKLD